MGKQRRKSGKELRQEAQNIQIVVTNSEPNEALDEDHSVTVLKPRKSSKNLAFDDTVQYSVEGDLFTEVNNLEYFCSIVGLFGPIWAC